MISKFMMYGVLNVHFILNCLHLVSWPFMMPIMQEFVKIHWFIERWLNMYLRVQFQQLTNLKHHSLNAAELYPLGGNIGNSHWSLAIRMTFQVHVTCTMINLQRSGKCLLPLMIFKY